VHALNVDENSVQLQYSVCKQINNCIDRPGGTESNIRPHARTVQAMGYCDAHEVFHANTDAAIGSALGTTHQRPTFAPGFEIAVGAALRAAAGGKSLYRSCGL